jgi:MFS family permease
METRDGGERALPPPGNRARGAARANFAGSLGQVLCSYGAPGSVLLTLFLKECLHADKWQIGLVMTMAFLGPTFEPIGAYLVERFRRRRLLFMSLYLGNRVPFLALICVPFLTERTLGIAAVLGIVALTRPPCHLGNPAWWSWMADLVPDRRHGRFFGLRSLVTSGVAALSFVVAMALLHLCGGMQNHALVACLFGAGAVCGIVDILLYLRVPEMPLETSVSNPRTRRLVLELARPTASLQALGIKLFGNITAPFKRPAYRTLILGMGLWSFSVNLLIPFVPLYQFGESLRGCRLGLGLSWKCLAALNVAASLAAMLSSRWWARWADRSGPRRLLIIGSGYLFVHLAYLMVGGGRSIPVLLLVAALFGGLSAAWTIGTNQLVLGLAPRENRSYYVAAFNFTNGWLMAGGPILGGLLADKLPITHYWLPCGLPLCYFHILLGLATAGGIVALCILLRSPAFRAAEAPAPAPILAARAVNVDKPREYATI